MNTAAKASSLTSAASTGGTMTLTATPSNAGIAKDVTGILVLRKVAGWSTKVEDATFGAYDNPAVVGS